jgi:hypothetical protein
VQAVRLGGTDPGAGVPHEKSLFAEGNLPLR